MMKLWKWLQIKIGEKSFLRRRQLLLQRARDLEELAALERGDNNETDDGADGGSEGDMD